MKKPIKQKPNWQSLSDIALIAQVIDGTLADSQEQYALFLQAKPKPHVLDDATLNRAEKLYKERVEFIGLDEEQLALWRKEKLTPYQEKEINRLSAQVKKLADINEKILSLIVELKKGSIDAILRMDTGELALKVMLGEMELPDDGDFEDVDTDEDESALSPKQYRFYILVNRKINQTNLPNYAFPTFREQFDMMEVLMMSEKASWQSGRLEKDFFIVREPYRQKFLKVQEKSILFYELLFDKHPELQMSKQLTDKQLKDFERSIYGSI